MKKEKKKDEFFRFEFNEGKLHTSTPFFLLNSEGEVEVAALASLNKQQQQYMNIQYEYCYLDSRHWLEGKSTSSAC